MSKYTSELGFLIFAAIIISAIPLVNIPFTWVAVFFHEISHGISALLTGGSIEKIKLHLAGSGLCYTRGGIRFVILQAGYLGAVFWGVLIYMIAGKVKSKHANIIIYAILGLIAISLILWSRDVITWIILLILFALFVCVLKFKTWKSGKIFLKFTGIYILLDAIKSPLYLIDGRHYGDGSKLADITHIPEFIWIVVWFAAGVMSLVYLWKRKSH
ncbi:MAG: M50 family metallopeptidase [Rickettsiales bacterium]|jgi:hypothetical protein|nr:M50 family metallopeptidase [Rickettsiales bacterium]